MKVSQNDKGKSFQELRSCYHALWCT